MHWATELQDQQRLQTGPLVVQVVLPHGASVAKPQELSAVYQEEGPSVDEKAAALLLAGGEQEEPWYRVRIIRSEAQR